MLQNILTKIFGTKSDRDTKALLPIVDEVNAIYESLKLKTDEELEKKTLQFKEEIVDKRKEVLICLKLVCISKDSYLQHSYKITIYKQQSRFTFFDKRITDIIILLHKTTNQFIC